MTTAGDESESARAVDLTTDEMVGLLLLSADFAVAIAVGLGGDGEPVSNAGLYVLAMLEERNEQRPMDLARRLALGTTAIARVIDRLEEPGYVSRKYGAVPGDRRGVIVHRTAKGERYLRRSVDRIADGLPSNVFDAARTVMKAPHHRSADA